MTHRPGVACSRELAARWCALAEKRLDHLTELFRSGRWRRYYTEQSLLDDIRHAKAAIQTWRALSVEPEPVSIVPSQTPSVIVAVPPPPVRQAEPETIAHRPIALPPAIVAVPPAQMRQAEPERIMHRSIELPPSLETILAESEIIVQAEVEPDGHDPEPDYVVEEDIEPELTAAPRIDMAALERVLRIGIAAAADDDEPVIDLDAIERRYPALAVAY